MGAGHIEVWYMGAGHIERWYMGAGHIEVWGGMTSLTQTILPCWHNQSQPQGERVSSGHHSRKVQTPCGVLVNNRPQVHQAERLIMAALQGTSVACRSRDGMGLKYVLWFFPLLANNNIYGSGEYNWGEG